MISTRIVRHLQSRFWSSKKLGSPKDVLELNSKPVKIAGNDSLAMFNDKLTLKINAVSLNSIDHWLINGRAANVRESYQKLTNLCVDQNFENSQIAGRDFHATVVSDNGLKFLEGSKVIGVCHPFDNGALSVGHTDFLCLKQR
jgi:NADPH:quinone reductase-like Zn-dependent oxidoreductase